MSAQKPVSDLQRCPWCGTDPLYTQYHDQEWGVPAHEDRHLFSMLLLEGAQAGLSWITVLRKREHYREALSGFDPQVIAAFGQDDISRLLGNAGIIRNRLKIEAMIRNARASLKIVEQFGSLDAYLWRFVDGQPIQNAWSSMDRVPATSPISDRLSKDLRQRGCNFVGSIICYAFMQAVGMVNDHLVSCYRHADLRS